MVQNMTTTVEISSKPTEDVATTSPNMFSRIFYTWLFPFFYDCYYGTFDERKEEALVNFPKLWPSMAAEKIAQRAEVLWGEIIESEGGKNKLLRFVLKFEPVSFWSAVVLISLKGVAIGVVQPLVVIWAMSVVADSASADVRLTSDSVDLDPIFVVVCCVCLTFCDILLIYGSHLFCDLWSHQVGAGLIHLILQKGCRIQRNREYERNSNLATSLITNDVIQSLEMMKGNIDYFCSCITAFPCGLFVCLRIIGLSGLLGILFLIVLGVFTAFLAKYFGAYYENQGLKESDNRLNVLQEVVNSMRGVKLFSWENEYFGLLSGLRKKESYWLRKWQMIKNIVFALGLTGANLASLVVFLPIYFVGGSVSADQVFATVLVLHGARWVTSQVALGIPYVWKLHVSGKRITDFLDLDEQPEPTILQIKPEQRDNFDFFARTVIHECKYYSGADQNSNSTKFALENFKFEVRPGELIAIVGPVGSGKTTLLQSMVGCGYYCTVQHDVQFDTSQSEIVADHAFVPQKQLIIGGTVRENILFGRDLNESFLTEVIQQAQLTHDLTLFPAGLDTELGERGLTLSGGQQARVAFARALYAEPKLLILDDLLAAVDAKVGGKIFNNCLVPFVRLPRSLVPEAEGRDSSSSSCSSSSQRSVVMALNQVHLLPQFDRILILGPNGKVEAFDSYKNLCEKGQLAHLRIGDSISSGATADDDTHKRNDKDEVEPSIQLLLANSRDEASHNHDDIANENSNHNPCPQGKLFKNDAKETGKRKAMVFQRVLKAGGYWIFILSFGLCLVSLVALVVSDRWLAIWVAQDDFSASALYPWVYVGIMLAHILLLNASFLISAVACTRAFRELHDVCVKRVLEATMPWIESTPSGRIISRFSADLAVVDKLFDYRIKGLMFHAIFHVIFVASICVLLPLATPVFIVINIVFFCVLMYIEPANQEAKRMKDVALSPVISNLLESITSSKSNGNHNRPIREFFVKRHEKAMNHWLRCGFVANSLVSCVFLCGVLFFGALAMATVPPLLFAVYLNQNTDDVLSNDSSELATSVTNQETTAGEVGIVFVYLFLLATWAQWLAKHVCEISSVLTSVERLLLLDSDEVPRENNIFQIEESTTGARARAPPGGELELEDRDPKPHEWALTGNLKFEEVSFRYRSNTPLALKCVSFEIEAGQKVSLVGRTGAGKSSVINVLMRLNEIQSGKILLDGTDISTVGLRTSRRKFGLIPQQAVLLQGTVRYNLDPFHQLADEDLLAALEKACLSRLSLHDEIGLGGAGLSSGEKQLLSFARCIADLKHKCMVLLDEPTSSVDLITDAKIQEVLRMHFDGLSVLAIAHRLVTVVDFDKIFVLDEGKLAEQGCPKLLLEDGESCFSKLADSTEGLRASLEQRLLRGK